MERRRRRRLPSLLLGRLFDEPVRRNVDSCPEFLFIANLHKETLMILITGVWVNTSCK